MTEPEQEPPPDPMTETIDVAARLQQPILRFEQTKPVPFRDLLLLLEEMAGVPIRYDEIEFGTMQGILERRVTLKQSQTTINQILVSLLAGVELSFRIEADGIRLIPLDSDPRASPATSTPSAQQ